MSPRPPLRDGTPGPRPAADRAGTAPRAGAAPALEIEGLSLSFGSAEILKDVSLTVPQGTFLGIIGPNGAGKTSLLNAIGGSVRATSGSLRILGQDMTTATVPQRAALGLGRTFQVSSVFGTRSVAENIWLAAAASDGTWKDLFRLGRGRDRYADRVERSLERVGLTDRRASPAAGLSHGEKRKLELGMVLATDARVLLLDEPMAGMGIEEVPALMELISAMHAEEHRTVLIVEHHLEAMMGLVQELAVMHHGSLLAHGPVAGVVSDPAVRQAYLGEEL
ncbi:ABC transporter ATP-binding protein [Streptomyces sp. NPDC055078]